MSALISLSDLVSNTSQANEACNTFNEDYKHEDKLEQLNSGFDAEENYESSIELKYDLSKVLSDM